MRIVFIILLSGLLYSISLSAERIENYDNLSCFLNNDFEVIQFSIESDSVLIFTNGIIYINADNKVENLLVVKGNVADYNVNLSNYPEAKIIDLKGAVAYPGFNDSHVHLMETSPFIVLGIDMKNCLTSSDIINSLASNVSKIKDGELMIGVGFSLEDYDKWSVDDLRKIDSITGNRLVFLGDKLGHNVIVNSATMNYCNITPQSEVPMGGILGGKNTGKLTGMFRESAMTLVGNKIFQLINKDLIKNTSLQMFKTWASFGYTGIVDLMGAAAGRILHPEIAMELENEGKLPIRIHYCYTIFDLNEIDSAVKYKDINSDMVRFVGCKLFVDGAYAAGQAWTSWVNMKGNNGLYYVFPTDSFGIKYNLNRIVEKLEEKRLNCHYHIQGDQGIENLLNALDNVVAKKGRLDCKHTIIHSAFITKSQMQRIVNFKGAVVMTTQPGFWEVEDNLEYYYGEHFYTAYPVKDIIDEGIIVGMSTDFTVSPISYCPASKVIGVAVTGGGKPENHKPLTVRDIIYGFTYGSNATTPSKDLGLLERGYKADLVVYDKDFYSIPPDQINNTNPKVKSIWISGKKIYELPDNPSTSVKYSDFIPVNIKLFSNYPNPFNSTTKIRWQSSSEGHTKLEVFDMLGRKVKTLVDEKKLPGDYIVNFETKELPSRIYFYQLKVENFIITQKMVLLK